MMPEEEEEHDDGNLYSYDEEGTYQRPFWMQRGLHWLPYELWLRHPSEVTPPSLDDGGGDDHNYSFLKRVLILDSMKLEKGTVIRTTKPDDDPELESIKKWNEEEDIPEYDDDDDDEDTPLKEKTFVRYVVLDIARDHNVLFVEEVKEIIADV